MRAISATLILLAGVGAACAEERYYALFFAHQTSDRKASEAHSYVEYIRAEIAPGCPLAVLQRDTISWMPASLVVRVGAWQSEPGRNLSLDQSLALGAGKQVMAWGPYELTPTAWRLAIARKAKIESGAHDYKAIDVVPGQSRHALNCVHAAAEIDPEARRLGQYNVKYGEFATRQIIRHYVKSGFLCAPCSPHDEIWQLLGLDGRCIERHDDWEPKGIGRLIRPGLSCK